MRKATAQIPHPLPPPLAGEGAGARGQKARALRHDGALQEARRSEGRATRPHEELVEAGEKEPAAHDRAKNEDPATGAIHRYSLHPSDADGLRSHLPGSQTFSLM